MARRESPDDLSADKVIRHAERASRKVSPWIDGLARAVYVAKGVVYIVIGVLAIRAATNTGGKTAGTPSSSLSPGRSWSWPPTSRTRARPAASAEPSAHSPNNPTACSCSWSPATEGSSRADPDRPTTSDRITSALVGTQNKKENPGVSLCSAGALAAGILVEACEAGPEYVNPLQTDTIREAALDLRDQFEALSNVLAHSGGDGLLPPALLAEGAVRCADLANLAACSVPALPGERSTFAVATVHLAAGTARAFEALVRDSTSSDGTDYAFRDARGAGWRAGLAVRQVEGPGGRES